jgi:hypothetical protein
MQSVPITTNVMISNHAQERCQWPLISSIKETDRHNIAEILLKVALNTIIISNLMTWHT